MPIFVIAWWHHDRRCNLTWVCIRVWAGNTYNTLDPWIRDTLSTWPNPNFLWFKMTNIANLHFSGGSQGCLYQRGSTVRPRVGAIPRLIDSERCNYWTMQALPVDKVWHCHRFDQWGGLLFLPTPWMVFVRLACLHCPVCSQHCFCLLLPHCSHNNGAPLMLRHAGLCEIHAVLMGCSIQFCAILR